MKLDTFINRPVLSTVISIFIVLLGIIGLTSLPITQYPDLAPPTIRVSTSYTGANAQAVLNSVIAPLEESINGAEGMTYMESTATNTGSADITVYFKQGFNADMAGSRCTEPCRKGIQPVACRGNPGRCADPETPDLHAYGCVTLLR